MIPKNQSSMASDIEKVLFDAAEMQLAALDVGIEYWSRWVDNASKLSQGLRRTLQDFRRKTSRSKESRRKPRRVVRAKT